MNTWKIGFAALLATGLLSGCGKNTPVTGPDGLNGTGSAEQTAVTDQLASNPEYVDDGVYESPDPTSAEASAEASASVEILPPPPGPRPLRFWRQITSVRRSFEFAFGDTDSTGRPTTAVVTVNKELGGTFNVETASGDSLRTRDVVRKPLRDHWVRRILLARVREPNLLDRPWRIIGTSGVKVTSRPATTRIVSLRLQATGFDSTIVDPLAFFRMRQILRFRSEDSVTVTATTLRNDDVVVLQQRDLRVAFHNNGDNTYTAVFHAGILLGVRHVGVNALSRGTIFDPQAPYDSQAWILPYVLPATRLPDDPA